MHRVGRQVRSGTFQQIHTDKLPLKQSWPTENPAFPGSFCFHLSYLPTFHPVVNYTRFSVTLRRLEFFNFSQKSHGGLAAQCLCPGKLKEENAKAESDPSAHGPQLWMVLGSGHRQSCGAEILSHTIDALVALQHCLHLLSEITACFLQH